MQGAQGAPQHATSHAAECATQSAAPTGRQRPLHNTMQENAIYSHLVFKCTTKLEEGTLMRQTGIKVQFINKGIVHGHT